MYNININLKKDIMKSYKRLIILSFIIGLVLSSIFVTIKLGDDGSMKLSPEESLAIANARLASANNALDGSGEFKQELCEDLGQIAKSFDSNSKFLKCTSPKSLYLSSPDTSDSRILTLSDDNYTATFTTDEDGSILLNYTFSNEKSPGFNSFEGRR